MKPTHGRVIKSEEVCFIQKPGKRITAAGLAGDTGQPGLDEERATSRSGISKESYLKKIHAVELQAHEKGLSEGIRKGRAMQKQESLQGIQTLNALIHEISGLRKSMLEGAEEQLLGLILAVAEKVIHMEVKTSREVIQHVLKAAIRNIVDRENMKVRVHPQDFQYLLDIKSDFLQGFDGIKNIVFEEDASILRGGAVVETAFGEVDARLDQQFDEIKSSLTRIRQG